MAHFDLDAAIAQATAREAAQQNAEAERRLEAERQQNAEQIAAFHTRNAPFVPVWAWEALALAVCVDTGSFGRVVAKGCYQEQPIVLVPGWGNEVTWLIACAGGMTTRNDTLEHDLLLVLGAIRQRADRQAKEVATWRREEERRAAFAAARQAESERLEARIEETVAAARAAAWQWPHGREVVLYRWTYQTGGGVYEDTYIAEHDQGWTTVDRLDNAGYVEFLPDLSHPSRVLKLDTQAHKPVIERHVFRAVGDLPYDLREHVDIRIDGIANVADYGEPPCYAEQDGGYVSRMLDPQPIAWLRKLIDG
jgi:hypothetical protein